MDYINIQGDENTIVLELSKYMNQGGAKLIIQSLSSFTDILDDDEAFEKREIQEQKDGFGFIVPKTNQWEKAVCAFYPYEALSSLPMQQPL